MAPPSGVETKLNVGAQLTLSNDIRTTSKFQRLLSKVVLSNFFVELLRVRVMRRSHVFSPRSSWTTARIPHLWQGRRSRFFQELTRLWTVGSFFWWTSRNLQSTSDKLPWSTLHGSLSDSSWSGRKTDDDFYVVGQWRRKRVGARGPHFFQRVPVIIFINQYSFCSLSVI